MANTGFMFAKLIIGDAEIELDVPSPSLAERLAKDEAIALELRITVQEKLQDIVARECAGQDDALVKSFELAFRRAWADEEAENLEAQIERAVRELRGYET